MHRQTSIEAFCDRKDKTIRALGLAIAMLLATPAVAQTVRDVPLSGPISPSQSTGEDFSLFVL
jgi:hypothetical protein